MMWRPAFVLLAALAIGGTGCSWIFVTPPPKAGEVALEACTDVYTAPVIDTVIAAPATLIVLGGLDLAFRRSDEVDALGLFVAALALPYAATFVPSAIYGYQHVGDCTTWKALQAPPLDPTRQRP